MNVQEIMTMLGAAGGLGGVAAGLTVFLQRHKFKAEAADVLTDTALTLVEPLKNRVRELETEATEAYGALRELREAVSDLTSTMRRWRAAILSPAVTREDLHAMVRAEHAAPDRKDQP